MASGQTLAISRLPRWKRWLGHRVPHAYGVEASTVAWGSESRPLLIAVAVLALCADLPAGEMAVFAVQGPWPLHPVIIGGDLWFALYCWRWIQYSKRNPHLFTAEGMQVMISGGRWMTIPAEVVESVAGHKRPQRRDFAVHDDEIQLSHGSESNVRVTLVPGVHYHDGENVDPVRALNVRADSPAEFIKQWREACAWR